MAFFMLTVTSYSFLYAFWYSSVSGFWLSIFCHKSVTPTIYFSLDSGGKPGVVQERMCSGLINCLRSGKGMAPRALPSEVFMIMVEEVVVEVGTARIQ